MQIPRVTAADIKAAATRLAGVVVQFVEDGTVGPAIYRARLDAFQAMESDEMWADDATVVVLVQPGTARDLIDTHGTAGKAAAAVNAELRRAAR
jgi:hypothetical protein